MVLRSPSLLPFLSGALLQSHGVPADTFTPTARGTTQSLSSPSTCKLGGGGMLPSRLPLLQWHLPSSAELSADPQARFPSRAHPSDPAARRTEREVRHKLPSRAAGVLRLESASGGFLSGPPTDVGPRTLEPRELWNAGRRSPPWLRRLPRRPPGGGAGRPGQGVCPPPQVGARDGHAARSRSCPRGSPFGQRQAGAREAGRAGLGRAWQGAPRLTWPGAGC